MANMTATARAAEQLRRAYEGEAWHGPALREILRGVSAAQAAARPLPGAHTIWELVLHVATWDNVVRERLDGATIVSLPPEQDWPATGGGPRAWRAALAALATANRRLRAAMLAFPTARLAARVPGKKYSFHDMLDGIVQHDLYHGGQIALLKKARRSR